MVINMLLWRGWLAAAASVTGRAEIAKVAITVQDMENAVRRSFDILDRPVSSEQCYEAYGLTLKSAIPLPARASTGRAPDHCIVSGDLRAITSEPPPGDIVS